MATSRTISFHQRPDPHNSHNYNWVGLYWSIGILVVAAIWLILCMVLRPNQVRSAARHAAEDRGTGVPTEDPLRY